MIRILQAARRIASPWLSYRERRRKERRQWETLLWMMRELDDIAADGLLAPQRKGR
jgi:hypothetical protein